MKIKSKSKSKPKVTVERMRVGLFRATLGKVLASASPVVLSNGGGRWSDPRAIVLIVPRFNHWDLGAKTFAAVVEKLKRDLDAAIDEIRPEDL